jgi:hypothetical protein
MEYRLMNRELRRTGKLPDFLVVGPQKAGTSWIHRYFTIRGDVCLPRNVKETAFFDRFYDRGIPWYGGHFRNQKSYRRTGEVASTYFHDAHAPARILDELGPIPLIITLRDPACRAFSLYLHLRRYGQTQLDFREAVRCFPVLLNSCRYATLVKRWIGTFGRDNLLILQQEHLANSPEAFASPIVQFLGLPEVELDPSLYQQINAAAVPPSFWLARISHWLADTTRAYGLYRTVAVAKALGLKPLIFGRPGSKPLPALTDEDRDWMISQLRQEISELEEILDLDLSHWRTVSTSEDVGRSKSRAA